MATNQLSSDEKIALWLGWKEPGSLESKALARQYGIKSKGPWVDPNGSPKNVPMFSLSIDAWHKHGLFDEIERRGLILKLLMALSIRGAQTDKTITHEQLVIETSSDPETTMRYAREYWYLLTLPASVLADALCEVI